MNQQFKIYLVPGIFFSIYMIFLLVTHRNILLIGEVSGESILIPIPFLVLLLHSYLVVCVAKYESWYIKIYCAGLAFSTWASFFFSSNTLRVNNIDVPSLLSQPLVILGLILFSLCLYVFMAKHVKRVAAEEDKIQEINVENYKYREQEDVRNTQKMKFKEKLGRIDSRFIDLTNEFIDTHISDTELDTKAIASQLHMTEKTFSRKLKTQLGITPGQYLKQRRMKKAYSYYIDDNYSSQKALSAAVGFKSSSYFAKQFQIYIEEKSNKQTS